MYAYFHYVEYQERDILYHKQIYGFKFLKAFA